MMRAFTRALAALATLTLLSVDDIEERKAPTMNRPNNVDPPAEPGVLDLAPYEARTETPIGDLLQAISRAASELEGQGEKSDRIALQLLTAQARFCAETGTP